jgi:hypothetical protein
MASNLTISASSYAGELALPYISAAILTGDTIANRYVTVKENVKFKAVLKKLASANLVKAASCSFDNSTSTLTLSEAVLQVTDLMTNIEVCKADFARDWEALQTGRGFINDVIPANFADFLLTYLAGKISEQIEFNLWQGNFSGSIGGASGYTSFDGLMKKLQDAFTTSPSYNIASALTPAGAGGTTAIMTAIDATVAAIPAGIMGSPNTKCYMSRKTFQIYMQACMAAGTGGPLQPADNAIFKQVYGYEIYVCPGFPNDCLLFAQPDNLFVGTDLVSDQNEVKVVDMSLTDASDNVRMAMRYRFGTQVGFTSDVAVAY